MKNRVNFKSHFLNGGPIGCAGTANKSGWMNDSSMELFMDHFVKFVRPSKERPALLLLDNHSSHMAINPLNFAKENHIHFLSFPAHCSHRLQPLDVSVYGPMKKFNSSAASAWMLNNPGKTMSIYDIPGIVGKSFPLAANPVNITSGFRQTGIVPFDREGFHSRADYDPGFVTDRVDPKLTVSLVEIDLPLLNEPFALPIGILPDEVGTDMQLVVDPLVEHNAVEHEVQRDAVEPDVEPGGRQHNSRSSNSASSSPVPFSNSPTNSSCSSTLSIKILEELRPFPKAGPRIIPQNNGRRKRTSAVLTDTPIKNVIEAEKAAVKTKAARKIVLSEQPPNSKADEFKKSKPAKRNKKEVKKKESFCPECGGRYSTTKEDWIRCTIKKCCLWACESCVDDRGEDENSYVCSKCSAKM